MLKLGKRLSLPVLLAPVLFCLATAVAWAAPTPKDITAAVNAGNLPQAEMMLREVLKEHPNSAKAFYELGEVLAREGHNAEARQSLLRAEQIDPSLGFASSPAKFRELMDKLPATETRPAPVQAANAGVSNGGSAAATVAPAPAQRGGLPTCLAFAVATGGGDARRGARRRRCHGAQWARGSDGPRLWPRRLRHGRHGHGGRWHGLGRCRLDRCGRCCGRL